MKDNQALEGAVLFVTFTAIWIAGIFGVFIAGSLFADWLGAVAVLAYLLISLGIIMYLELDS